MGMKEFNEAWKIVKEEYAALPDNQKKLKKAENIKEFGIRNYRKTLKAIKNDKPENISDLDGYVVVDPFGRRYKVAEDGSLTEI